jgi:hypothetical protein
MAAMRTAYLADHGLDDAPPSMIPWCVQYAIALSALTPLTGVVDPNGVVTGLFGQTYYNTATLRYYTCTSNPTGTAWVISSLADLGAVAVLEIEQSGVPVAGQLLTIGADVYEADGAGANINFVIAAAEPTMDNLLAAAVANGTENLFWDKIDATHLRLRSADGPQGNVVPGDPALAVSENLANYLLSTGTPGNLNTEGGRAAGVSLHSVSTILVTAAHAAIGQIRLALPFTAARFIVQVRTAAGLLLNPAADAFTIAGGNIFITLAGGAGNIAAGDTVTVEAWS